ncbi:MAG: hypothetical protein Q4D93_02350 [Porphyromonas sp.]|nr:hypothetical protein [Porphyromonas sp.]
MKKNTIVSALALAGTAAVTYGLYKEFKKYRKRMQSSFCPVIASIDMYEDGVLSDLMTFDWDDEECCVAAHHLQLDEQGVQTAEKLMELEYHEDRVLIAEYDSETEELPTLSSMLLDPFGMAKTCILRSTGGEEKRTELLLKGNELHRMVSDDDVTTLEWEDGNLTRIDFGDGATTASFTYYTRVNNPLFPDLNFLLDGLSGRMINSYLLGLRSRNFVRTINLRNEDSQVSAQVSYLCDHFDRPVQILMELTEVNGGATKKVSREYEITYFA